MTTITTREISGVDTVVKNNPLSNAEIDNNFINLNNSKVEKDLVGAVNGIATLDENEKISASQIPDTLATTSFVNLAVQRAGSTWLDYAINWASEPTFMISNSQGDIYQYAYHDSFAYRLIPTDNISIDSFYSSLNGTILTGLLAQRGNL